MVPEKGITEIYSTIEKEKVQSVDADDGTISVDFTLTMKWMDPNIKTNISEEDKAYGRIVLSKEAIEAIWTPDLYILNRKFFKFEEEWISLKSASILTTQKAIINYKLENKSRKKTSSAIVTIKYEVKATVHCDFHLSNYPMDKQLCSLRFGSGSHEAIFRLDNSNTNNHQPESYQADNFEMTITFSDKHVNDGSNTVGIRVAMSRLLTSFIMIYYIPCIAIVIACSLSFVIPEYPEGRIALLVTLFLTLINLFIYQMVSKE